MCVCVWVCVCVGGGGGGGGRWVGLMKLKVNYNDVFFEENRENSEAQQKTYFM